MASGKKRASVKPVGDQRCCLLPHWSEIRHERIKLYKGIKESEKRLNHPDVVLNSFILSYTRYPQLKWNEEQKEL